MTSGDRMLLTVPKRSALGAALDERGVSRRRMVTIVDPMAGMPLVRIEDVGDVEVPEDWLR